MRISIDHVLGRAVRLALIRIVKPTITQTV
jgi:hypothetical protein